jgi:hypothetical protein
LGVALVETKVRNSMTVLRGTPAFIAGIAMTLALCATLMPAFGVSAAEQAAVSTSKSGHPG